MDATAVPNTLAVAGAPKAAKSVTTFRGGEPGTVAFGEDGAFTGDERTGEEPYDDAYELRVNDWRACRYLSVKRVPCTYSENAIKWSKEQRRELRYPS